MPAEQISQEDLDDLRDLFAAMPPFSVSFRESRRFPEVLYLAPEPAEPFARLTEAIVERWPDYRPYEGEFETPIPHLTVAHGNAALLDEAETDVGPKLPIKAAARDARLLEELEPDWVRWGERACFSLGS